MSFAEAPCANGTANAESESAKNKESVGDFMGKIQTFPRAQVKRKAP